MNIANIVNRIQTLNEERYSKNFDPLKELSFIVEELSEGLRRHDNINEKIDFNADVAVFSIGATYKALANYSDHNKVSVLQFINRVVNILSNNEMKSYVEKPELLYELINDKSTVDVESINQLIKSTIDNIVLSTAGAISKHSNIMKDDAVLSAQVNDILVKVVRINEINIAVNAVPEQRYEYPIVFSMIFLGALVNIEVLGYDCVKVMDEVIKHIESRKGELNSETGKWEKDRNQDPATLYQPDFEKCKKVSE